MTTTGGPFGKAVLASLDRVRGSARDEALTDREATVLRRLCSQRPLDEIAADLTVSSNTVKIHVRAIYSKLGARTRRQAIAIAHQRGLA